MMITCKICGGAHPIWDCKRPAHTKTLGGLGKSEPADRSQTENSALSMSGVPSVPLAVEVQIPQPPTNPPKRKRGRPPTGFDKAAYNRSYMVKKRARLKAEKEAGK